MTAHPFRRWQPLPICRQNALLKTGDDDDRRRGEAVVKRGMAEPDEHGASYQAIFGDVSKIIDAARDSAPAR